MYLNYLDENERIAFLRMAYLVARIDDNFSDNEKVIIGSFCNEIGIDGSSINPSHNDNVADLVKHFKSTKSKKIVVLELMSIINADGKLDLAEEEIMEIIIKYFDLDGDYFNDVKKWSDLMLSLIDQGSSLIHSK